jgi:AcrR family transcriptional regulator
MSKPRERSARRGRSPRQRSSDRAGRGPIWGRPAPGSRRPTLSRDIIAAAALEIADHEGFDAVSMRRIAEKLGAGTMTLYYYMRTKDDLLALMDDALIGEALVPAGELAEDWRGALAAIARRTRDAFLRHPWAFKALQGARMGPNGLRHVEQSMAAVATAPLDLAGKVALCGVIDDFVFGYVLRNIDAPPMHARVINELVRAHLASGQFPLIAQLVGDETPSAVFQRAGAWMRDETRFEFGLQAILDAVAAGRTPVQTNSRTTTGVAKAHRR